MQKGLSFWWNVKSATSGEADDRTETFLVSEESKYTNLIWLLGSAPTTIKDTSQRSFWIRVEEIVHHIALHSSPLRVSLSWYWVLRASIFQGCRVCSRDDLRWQQLSTAWRDAAEGAQIKPQLQLSVKHGSEKFTYGASTVSTLSGLPLVLRNRKITLIFSYSICNWQLSLGPGCVDPIGQWGVSNKTWRGLLASIVFSSICYVSIAEKVFAGLCLLKCISHRCRLGSIRDLWMFLKGTTQSWDTRVSLLKTSHWFPTALEHTHGYT